MLRQLNDDKFFKVRISFELILILPATRRVRKKETGKTVWK